MHTYNYILVIMSIIGILYINKYNILIQNHNMKLMYIKEIEKSIKSIFSEIKNDLIIKKNTNHTSYSKFFCKNKLFNKYLNKEYLQNIFIDLNITLNENINCKYCNGNIKGKNCNQVLFSWTN